jgi:phosphoglycerate kinase
VFTKKTIKDIELKNKTVLLRADYNVPVAKNGKIGGDYRIQASIPTLQYLLKQNCKVIICSHLGRPEGHRNSQFSLRPVATHLEKLLKQEVQFVEDCIGPGVEQAIKELKRGQVLLLENLRFYPEEEKNQVDFAKKLAKPAQIFVQDGFGVVHRAHASTDAITKFLPSVAGLLLEKEVDTITEAMQKPKRPLMAIIGGAKISDKIEVIEQFIKTADMLVIGGAMANTFLLAKGIKVGESKAESDDLDEAREIMKKAKAEAARRPFIFYMPHDAVVADDISKTTKTRIVDWDAHVIASIENYPKQPPRSSEMVKADEKILDIGPFSGAFINGLMQTTNMVIWNGTMGVTETPSLHGPVGPFAHGTELIIEGLLGEFGHRPYSLIGGGDTAAYIEDRNLVKFFNHVSTGGGASLELIAGKKLPGVETLEDKGK